MTPFAYTAEEKARLAAEHETRTFPAVDDGEYLTLVDPLPWLVGQYRVRHQHKRRVLGGEPTAFHASTPSPAKIVKVFGRVTVTQSRWLGNEQPTIQVLSVEYADGGEPGDANCYPVNLEKVG